MFYWTAHTEGYNLTTEQPIAASFVSTDAQFNVHSNSTNNSICANCAIGWFPEMGNISLCDLPFLVQEQNSTSFNCDSLSSSLLVWWLGCTCTIRQWLQQLEESPRRFKQPLSICLQMKFWRALWEDEQLSPNMSPLQFLQLSNTQDQTYFIVFDTLCLQQVSRLSQILVLQLRKASVMWFPVKNTH